MRKLFAILILVFSSSTLSAGISVGLSKQVGFVNGTTRVTLILSASPAAPLTNLSFSLNLPSAYVNASSSPSSSCGGTFNAPAGATTASFSGGSLPSGVCTVVLPLIDQNGGGALFSVPAGAVTADGGQSNGSAASIVLNSYWPLVVGVSARSDAGLAVVGEPIAIGLGVGGNASGPAGTFPNVSVTAHLSSGFVFTPPASSTVCTTGTASANSSTLSISNALLEAGKGCAVSVPNVTASAPGVYHVTFDPATDFSLPGYDGDKVITVPQSAGIEFDNAIPIVVTPTFSPAEASPGTPTTLAIELHNTSSATMVYGFEMDAALTGAFSGGQATTNCTKGQVSFSGSGNQWSLRLLRKDFGVAGSSEPQIPASGSCFVTLAFTPAASGSYSVSIPARNISTYNRGRNLTASSASMVVVNDDPKTLTVAKSFAPDSVGPNQPSRLSIAVTNPANFSLSNLAFHDSYPSGLVNAAAPNATSSCGGAITANAGAGSLDLSGGTLPASGVCRVEVDVVAANGGTYTNTIAASAATAAHNASGPATPQSATLIVRGIPPTLSKAFDPTVIGPGGTSQLRLTLQNPNPAPLQGVFINDSYPAGLRNAAPPRFSNTCGGTVTATPGDGSLSLSGGLIPAGGSCSVVVSVNASGPGTLTNTIPASGYGAATSTPPSAGASASLTVIPNPPPAVEKSFSPQTVGPSHPSTLTITLTNSGSSASTPVSFADTYPEGLVNSPVPNASTTCTGTVLASAGAGELQASGISVPPHSSCTIVTDVEAGREGQYENTVTVAGNSASAVLRVVVGRRRPR